MGKRVAGRRLDRPSPTRGAALIAAVTSLALITGVLPSTPPAAAQIAAPIVVSIGDASVHEGDTGKVRPLKFAVTLSEPSDQEVVVSYVISGVTASAPDDFNDFKGKTKTLKFKPSKKTGLTPTSKFVNVPVNPDTEVEGDETLRVTITGVDGADVGDAVATGTIIDDDPAEGARLAIGDATVVEGDVGTKNKVQLWVTLSEPAPTDVSFDLALGGGTATPGVDYRAVKPKTIVMREGKWKKAVTLIVYPDTELESDETIELSISSTDPNVVVVDGTGVATIVDDDGEPAGPDEFAIAVGEVVSDGVPAVGAGNIESPGAQDVYTFEATAGQSLFFDVLTDPCSLVGLDATLLDPNDVPVFSNRGIDCGSLTAQDFGPFSAAATGTYTLSVVGAGDATGTYSFRVVEAPAPEQFVIAVGEVVSDGVPAVGAGNIESPGAQDVYTFEATAGQSLFFDVLTDPCSLVGLRATLLDPDDVPVFSNRGVDCGGLASQDFGPFSVEETGTFTLVVGGEGANDDVVGTYSFTVIDVPLGPEQFLIAVGDVVSDGVPAVGAGNIESPGAQDVYTFEATAGQSLFFDVLTDPCSLVGLRATLLDPDDVPVFSNRGIDCGGLASQDFGPFSAAVTGTYTLSVVGAGDTTGTYSFSVVEVPPPQAFLIAVGDVVSDGVPAVGAGNIESPGAQDVYTFEATAGQSLFVDVLTTCNLVGLDATLLDPNGAPVFSNRRIDCGGLTSQDFGPFTAPETGAYVLTVDGVGANSDTTGTYSFSVVEVPPPDEFAIAVGDVVSDGVPAVGAGNIEAPGARDVYTFEAVAGQSLFFDVLTNPCTLIGLRATLLDPNDVPVFSNRGIDCGSLASHDFGPFTVGTTGTFTLAVGGLANDDTVGVYSFAFLLQSP